MGKQSDLERFRDAFDPKEIAAAVRNPKADTMPQYSSGLEVFSSTAWLDSFDHLPFVGYTNNPPLTEPRRPPGSLHKPLVRESRSPRSRTYIRNHQPRRLPLSCSLSIPQSDRNPPRRRHCHHLRHRDIVVVIPDSETRILDDIWNDTDAELYVLAAGGVG